MYQTLVATFIFVSSLQFSVAQQCCVWNTWANLISVSPSNISTVVASAPASPPTRTSCSTSHGYVPCSSGCSMMACSGISPSPVSRFLICPYIRKNKFTPFCPYFLTWFPYLSLYKDKIYSDTTLNNLK